jgi:hypothetical protein
MKKVLFSVIMIFLIIQLNAQNEDTDTDGDTLGWRTGGMASLTFSQVGLYQWSAGGEPSISGAALLNVFANDIQLDHTWENSLSLGYGLIKQGETTRKSNDRIEFSSKYGKKATDKWSYSALLNFRTQFAEGYQYQEDGSRILISNFMAPAYLTASLGMDYKPIENLSIFISPLTSKFTFVLDDSLAARGNFGLDPGEKFRAELGGLIKVEYTRQLMENVDLSTKMDFFSNYLNNPQNIDFNGEILLNMKINEYLAVTVNAIFIYDDDVALYKDDDAIVDGPGWQIKEVIGIGFSYKF